MVPIMLTTVLVCTACSGLALGNHLQAAPLYGYHGPALAREDQIFLERDALTRHQQAVRSPHPLPSPFPYKYPYYPALSGSSLPPPQLRPKYDYPFPPIPTYPPTPPTSRRPPLLPPSPAITFLDPAPSPSPGSHIEVRPRSFTPRPQTGGGGQLYQRDHLEQEQEADSQTILPKLTLQHTDTAHHLDDDDDDDAGGIQVSSNQTLQLESPRAQPGSHDQLEDDNEDSEDFEALEEVDYITEEPEFTTVETEQRTEGYQPDIRENEVITEVTLGEVLDEIFSDPELPHHNRNDVPRSPQFFVPTPLPTLQTEQPFDPSRDEHSFHEEFIESPEGVGSFQEHRLRDQQDLSLAEMLLHHHEEQEEEEEEEEVHGQSGQFQTNIINILSEERPQGPKGRKVLKKRPIRIKIPAKMSENLQSITIPESLHLPDVHELPSNVEITSPASPPPRQNSQSDNEEQEARQPKALHVFSDDNEVEQRNDNIFDPNKLNLPPPVRQPQQSGLPEDFQPIFTSETDRTSGAQTNRFVPQTSSSQAFSAQSLPLNTNPPPPRRPPPPPPPPPTRRPPPPPFPPQFPAGPRLRRPEDYIFSPRQVVPSLPSLPSRPSRPAPTQNFNFQQNPLLAGSQGFAAEENPIPTQPSFLEPQPPVRSQKAFPQQNFNQNSLNAGAQTGTRFIPTSPPPPPPPSGPIPSQNEQSLFQMLNREVAERPVRTRLTDNATLQNKPKSSALENLLAIAGPDWDSNLHVSKSTSSVSDFQCPAVEGYFPDPEVCTVYYQCAGGTAHVQNCQPGLKWNVLINLCDWEDNVDCDFNRGVKPIPPPDTPEVDVAQQQLPLSQQQQQQQQQPQFQQQQQQQQQQPFAAFTAFSF